MNIIELQPDDAIVVTLVEQLSKEQRDDLVAQVRRDFGMRRVVVLDSGSQITVVRHMTVVSRAPETDAGIPASNETQGVGEREVQHVDTDEPEAEGIPPHVWLYRNMLTDLQALAPLGRDETNGQYAVAIDQLTDAQRAIPHVAGQLDEQNNDM